VQEQVAEGAPEQVDVVFGFLVDRLGEVRWRSGNQHQLVVRYRLDRAVVTVTISRAAAAPTAVAVPTTVAIATLAPTTASASVSTATSLALLEVVAAGWFVVIAVTGIVVARLVVVGALRPRPVVA